MNNTTVITIEINPDFLAFIIHVIDSGFVVTISLVIIFLAVIVIGVLVSLFKPKNGGAE